MDRYGLTDFDNEIIKDIFKNYPNIKEVIVFGSRATGSFRKASDIDFAIKGDNISNIIGNLIADFEESDLIYRVDIVDYGRIKSENLLENVNNFGKIYYQKMQCFNSLKESP
ncbi:MAG: nucleotidyltransferase domain-containing protein [Candidatus Delongbacteria bacterium]|nr:nucleotidyltransferase domain-containing protein [Candidatus Delongbacteria bacterium]MBN2836726.1 nucleotidyltransferase domain-containing protein [Candidatus Delongbacteria bacterium]